ncbi:uncharacterized protein LOC143914246 [Arctopsyche grandis]|uniref:uncharacterized protein LOC143914246 n=1 Tax=Arctopsyche grandis TaxID=121162 RepID=UPI00406D8D83
MDEVTRQNLISRSSGLNNDEGPWGDEFLNNNEELEISMGSTIAPSVIAAGSTSIITTIVVIAIVVIIIVAGLFAMAIFIDYRQQNYNERQQQCIVKKRRSMRLKLPHCRRIREPSGIIEDAEQPGQSRPPLETITEVV